MRFGPAFLARLASMICGDEPFTFFPYRSSSKLTGFFTGLDLDFVHDGSTRGRWVNDVLVQLNKRPEQHDSMPSREMQLVIEHVIHPDHFLFEEKSDHAKAVDSMMASLKSSGLTVSVDSRNNPKLCLLTGEFVSTAFDEPQTENLITFKPRIFEVPKEPLNDKLVSVMMPFSAEFNDTYSAIQRVAEHMNLECSRADDMWTASTFIQDIFSLVFRSHIVVVDFTGRNPNVMYETGIAHTLGKNVVPITQAISDVPSDLWHHRALKYLPNKEGYRNLSNSLYERFKVLTASVT